MSATRAVYYTGAGETLGVWEVDVGNADLTQRSSVTLPSPAMYGWPSPDRRFFYMTSSDGGPYGSGTRHFATAWKIDGATGDLAAHGEPVALPARPIHASLDRAGRPLLTCYNTPSSYTVHRIEADGRIGAPVPQDRTEFGIYAHQILTTPGDRGAILIARGNDATDAKPEDPGSLHVFGYADGKLTHRREIAPGGGYGFGPRHLDFHPTEPLVLLSVEREDRLDVYRLTAAGDLEPEPLYRRDCLIRPDAIETQQVAGFVRAHPNGRFVYQSNRTFGRLDDEGRRVSTGGENNIAVWRLGSTTGEPQLVQHADAASFHLRNCGIDPSGRLLVASSIEPAVMADGSTLPAALAVMRIAEDGRLDLARRIDVDVAGKLMFWSGLVDLP